MEPTIIGFIDLNPSKEGRRYMIDGVIRTRTLTEKVRYTCSEYLANQRRNTWLSR